MTDTIVSSCRLRHAVKLTDNKCIVHGCSNHTNQGRFVGDVCSPCYTMITTGKIMPTDSFLNQITALESENEELERKLIALVSRPKHCD
jgi:hypothetical protein